jgi:hypothetical protein
MTWRSPRANCPTKDLPCILPARGPRPCSPPKASRRSTTSPCLFCGIVTLEVSLAPGHEVLATFQDFAAQHNLALIPLASKPLELEESLTLAACHVPGSKLFVYSEKAMLTARATPEGNVQLVVKGDFKSRKIPCQETDLLLHLERPGSTRLLNYCFSVIRGRS